MPSLANSGEARALGLQRDNPGTMTTYIRPMVSLAGSRKNIIKDEACPVATWREADTSIHFVRLLLLRFLCTVAARIGRVSILVCTTHTYTTYLHTHTPATSQTPTAYYQSVHQPLPLHRLPQSPFRLITSTPLSSSASPGQGLSKERWLSAQLPLQSLSELQFN